jgi:hypothetical protein
MRRVSAFFKFFFGDSRRVTSVRATVQVSHNSSSWTSRPLFLPRLQYQIWAIARFLQVPGIDKGTLNVRRSLSATVKHASRLATLDIVPLHTVPLLRPSQSSTVASCKGSTDPPSASQRMSELACNDNEDEDGDTSRDPAAPSIIFAMEQLRLRAFSTPDLSSAWFFLDCYAPTSLHAANVLSFLVGARPIPAPEAFPFRLDSCAMHEMVIFFWDALHSFVFQSETLLHRPIPLWLQTHSQSKEGGLSGFPITTLPMHLLLDSRISTELRL